MSQPLRTTTRVKAVGLDLTVAGLQSTGRQRPTLMEARGGPG
jgi:hypothetical protein